MGNIYLLKKIGEYHPQSAWMDDRDLYVYDEQQTDPEGPTPEEVIELSKSQRETDGVQKNDVPAKP